MATLVVAAAVCRGACTSGSQITGLPLSSRPIAICCRSWMLWAMSWSCFTICWIISLFMDPVLCSARLRSKMEFFFPGWEAAVSPTLGALGLRDTTEGSGEGTVKPHRCAEGKQDPGRVQAGAEGEAGTKQGSPGSKGSRLGAGVCGPACPLQVAGGADNKDSSWPMPDSANVWGVTVPPGEPVIRHCLDLAWEERGILEAAPSLCSPSSSLRGTHGAGVP